MILVLAINFGEQVKPTGGHKEVTDFRELGDLMGHGVDLPRLDSNPDHRCRIPSQELRFCDADDLQYPVFTQPLNATADRPFRDAQLGGDIGKRHAPVVLEVGDDRSICLVWVSHFLRYPFVAVIAFYIIRIS
jgi:hypothetical protein